MSVRDLFKGIAVASGNDAVVAMAEKIAGTEKAFVGLMNDKAKELKMTSSVFTNPTGLDDETQNYSTAYLLVRRPDNHQSLHIPDLHLLISDQR